MSTSLKEIKFLEDLPDQVLIIDKFKTINYANKASKNHFGPNIENQNISSIVRDPSLLSQIDESLEKNKSGILDIEIKQPNFQFFKVSVMPGPKNLLADSDTVIIFFKDLTDIIKVQKLKSDFVANVSHELRTPLQSIKLGLETINNGHATKDLESQKKILPVVLQQTSRMENIVNDLLSLSRIELQEHIRPNDKKSIKTNGDRNRLIEVFNNLIDNAIKYSEKNKKIIIKSKIEGDYFIVVIKDEGIGISKENIPQITERFFRVDPAKSKEVGGTGLGLAIVKHIVNQHRAEMTISSEINKGTEITLNFPIN